LDPEFVEELFSQFGPVSVRRMFGGAGIFADGVMFGLIFEGAVYLKADEAAIPAFEREGSKPFVYPLAKKPRVRKKPSTYWRLPERLYDDPDELARWAAGAFAIAQRKATKSRKGTKAGRVRKASVRQPAAARSRKLPGRPRK
jgi:DNA transformation protein